MKKSVKFFFAALVLVAAVSCSKTETTSETTADTTTVVEPAAPVAVDTVAADTATVAPAQ
jgi:hypothetical protein